MFHAIFEGAMFSAACLGVIALSLVALVIVFIRISSQTHQSIQLLQADIHRLSIEMMDLLNALNEFVRADLHNVSKETSQLISKLNELSADVNDKSHSLNFLFKPFRFLNDKLGAASSSDEPPSPSNTIPQTIKWVGSSMSLIKTIKEFLKSHGK